MAVWSKVQGSPKSWSKLKQVCLNGTIQSAVRMCHTECRYEWRLLAYLGDIFLQGVHFSLSESFCDLEPAQWERNSVQLLHCWILNKCVCVYTTWVSTHMDSWRAEKPWAEDCCPGKSPCHQGHQCPWEKEGPLTLTAWHPHQLRGYRGLWGGWNSLGEGPGRWMGGGGGQGLLVEMKYCWDLNCREQIHSQAVETGLKPQLSPWLLSWGGLCRHLTKLWISEWRPMPKLPGGGWSVCLTVCGADLSCLWSQVPSEDMLQQDSGSSAASGWGRLPQQFSWLLEPGAVTAVGTGKAAPQLTW